MIVRRWMTGVGGAAVLALLPTLAGASGAMAMQDGGEEELHHFVISAVACESAPTATSAECQPKVGASFEVATQDGEVLGTCTTEAVEFPTGTGAVCEVTVPFGITVVVTEDISTIPAGYAPLENPQTAETPPSRAGGGVSAEYLLCQRTPRRRHWYRERSVPDHL